MKQKDVALIILISAISAVISFAASHILFATPANREQRVAVVDKTLTGYILLMSRSTERIGIIADLHFY